jgi:hypothetical protein
MKTSLVLAFLILPGVIPLRADVKNWLQNGDFSDGIAHWNGDGRSAGTASDSDIPDLSGNPLSTPAGQGMIIRLSPHDWVKVYQDCRPVGNFLGFVVTYKVSDDFKLSQDMNDYINVPGSLGYGTWKAFNGTPGCWLMMMSDFGSGGNVGAFRWDIDPGAKVNADGTRTFVTHSRVFNTEGDKTLTLACPPGTGSITLLKVSLAAETVNFKPTNP